MGHLKEDCTREAQQQDAQAKDHDGSEIGLHNPLSPLRRGAGRTVLIAHASSVVFLVYRKQDSRPKFLKEHSTAKRPFC